MPPTKHKPKSSFSPIKTQSILKFKWRRSFSKSASGLGHGGGSRPSSSSSLCSPLSSSSVRLHCSSYYLISCSPQHSPPLPFAITPIYPSRWKVSTSALQSLIYLSSQLLALYSSFVSTRSIKVINLFVFILKIDQMFWNYIFLIINCAELKVFMLSVTEEVHTLVWQRSVAWHL